MFTFCLSHSCKQCRDPATALLLVELAWVRAEQHTCITTSVHRPFPRPQSATQAVFPGCHQHHLWLVLFWNTTLCSTQLCWSPVLDAFFYSVLQPHFSPSFLIVPYSVLALLHPVQLHPTTIMLSVSAAGKKYQEQDSWSLYLKFPIQILWISCDRWWWIWKSGLFVNICHNQSATVIQILLLLFENWRCYCWCPPFSATCSLSVC